MSSTTTTTIQPLTIHPTSEEGERYGILRYVAAGHEPEASPHNFHLPAIAEFGDIRKVPLHDMRPVPTVTELPIAKEGTAQLKTHGFTAVRHPTTLHSAPHTIASWRDPELLKKFYVPETEEMVRQITGAKRVVTEGLLLRSALWSESDALATHGGHGAQKEQTEREAELSELEKGFPQFIGFNPAAGGASPAPKIHLDYAPDGARTHIRKYHPKLRAVAADIIAAEDKITATDQALRDSYRDTPDAPRWALFSIWRPLKKVRRDPLALGDQQTFRPEDYVPTIVKTPNLGVEGQETHDAASYLGRWSPGQKWYWISEQEPEEVLVVGLFDSEREKEDPVAGGGTLHSSVDLEGAENEEARESLELRCLAVW